MDSVCLHAAPLSTGMHTHASALSRTQLSHPHSPTWQMDNVSPCATSRMCLAGPGSASSSCKCVCGEGGRGGGYGKGLRKV